MKYVDSRIALVLNIKYLCHSPNRFLFKIKNASHSDDDDDPRVVQTGVPI